MATALGILLAGFISAFAMAAQSVGYIENSGSHAFDQSGCNEDAGIKAIYKGKMPEAYEMLKECEKVDASGIALHHLQALIYYERLGSYKSLKERVEKSQELSCRAALKGHDIAVSAIAFMYLNGSSTAGLEPNDEIRICLTKIPKISLEYVDPKNVEACLSLNPDIDPTYECY
jgi:hypothetical protein